MRDTARLGLGQGCIPFTKEAASVSQGASRSWEIHIVYIVSVRSEGSEGGSGGFVDLGVATASRQ